MVPETQDSLTQQQPAIVANMIEERDNLHVVVQARSNTDLIEMEAYNYLKGEAKQNNLTATVSLDP
jgi:hypothetical protein